MHKAVGKQKMLLLKKALPATSVANCQAKACAAVQLRLNWLLHAAMACLQLRAVHKAPELVATYSNGMLEPGSCFAMPAHQVLKFVGLML